MEDIYKYPRLICDGSAELFKATERFNEITAQIKRVEAHVLLIVTGETTTAGKAIYSNESSRAAEVQLRLGDNPAYQQLSGARKEVEQQRAAFTAAIQQLRDEFRIALIDYEFTKLGPRGK